MMLLAPKYTLSQSLPPEYSHPIRRGSFDQNKNGVTAWQGPSKMAGQQRHMGDEARLSSFEVFIFMLGCAAKDHDRLLRTAPALRSKPGRISQP
jgi:hypothetical protein